MATRKETIKADPQVVYCPDIFAKRMTIKLIVRCHSCRNDTPISIGNYWKFRKNNTTPWSCQTCKRPAIALIARDNPLYKDETYRQRFRDLHKDPEYSKRVHSKTVFAKISATAKASWADRTKRAVQMAHRLTPAYRERISRWAKKQWADESYRSHQIDLRSQDEYRRRASAHSNKLWANPTYRALIINALDKARPSSAPKSNISSLQTILYKILEDLGLDYEQEGRGTIVGPIITSQQRFEGYSFDCLVRHNGRTLLIDCHGEYWHRGEVRLGRDRAKSTFINNYFPQYELLVIWEYEYRSPTRIKTIISERLGLTPPVPAEFSFDELEIATEEVTPELHCFLATNHYLANIGRSGSYRVIARHRDQIVGAAIFASPTRKESYERLGVKKTEILELTRFCIHSAYHKKNFASWLIGKAVRLVRVNKQTVRVLLSFADSGFGHNGTIYKATNWRHDGDVKPDYWYSDGKDWYHKKSIWDLANKLGQNESTYAATRGLRKVTGRGKHRFVLWLHSPSDH